MAHAHLIYQWSDDVVFFPQRSRSSGRVTVLNLTIGRWLADSGHVLRTVVPATIAVPIVIYGIMPRLHRIRGNLLARRAA